MNIQRLQKELVKKIVLISEGVDIEINGKEALKIINELKDHINDSIVVGGVDNNQSFTALDCVIIADSQGNDSSISERSRVGNRALKILEDAIRNFEGKTLRELGGEQDNPYDQSEFQKVVLEQGIKELVQKGLDFEQRLQWVGDLLQASNERIETLKDRIQIFEQMPKQELQDLKQMIQKIVDLKEASAQGLRVLSEVLLGERILSSMKEVQEVRALVQSSEQSMQTLAKVLEQEPQTLRDSNRRITKKEICSLCIFTLGLGLFYLAHKSRNVVLDVIGLGCAVWSGEIFLESLRERQVSKNLENSTVQPGIEERRPTLG